MPPLVVIFLTVFIDLLGFGILIPLLPFYAERFGGSALTVGLLSTSFSLMQFLFAPFWGRWSDRIGRRPVILIGLAGSAVSYLLFGLATSLPVPFAARICAGIAGANISTAQAFIADTTTPENRAKGMGLIGAAFGLGFIFGPAAGGLLSRWGYGAPAFFASGLALLNLCAAWFVLPESHKAARDGRPYATPESRLDALKRALTQPHLPVLLCVYFVVVAGFSGFETTFALFSERRFRFTAVTVGYVFAGVGVVMAVVQGGLVGRAVRRFGEQSLVSWGLLVVAVGLALVPLSSSVLLLSGSLAVLSIGMGLGGPSMTSLISRLSDSEDQGGVLGVTQSLASLARVIGPAWAGYAFDRFGIGFPYVSSAVLILLAFGVSVVGLRGWALDAAPELVTGQLPAE